jgi:tRNA dimethylallyltransferase
VANTGAGVGRLVVISGATGTGKSDLAVDLALRLNGEVVNADSMQLYRGMDIGTAKLPLAERHGVPHHLLDVLDVTERASVAAYQRDARRVIEDILARGRTPLLTGGSGLYVQAVVDEIAFPATDSAVRSRLEDELSGCGADALWARLAERDPRAAEVIDPRNGRRIVRALEVIEVTGKPFTATFPTPGAPRYDAALICLDRDTAALDERRADRVHAMVRRGLMAEVRTLVDRGLRRGVTAWRALGYRQLLTVLDGERSEEDAVADTIVATRRFVRRQRSWFRRDSRLTWIDAGQPHLVDRCVQVATARSVR